MERKKITLKRRKSFDVQNGTVVKKQHPQGKKISSDLYKALNIIAKTFAKNYLQTKRVPFCKQEEIEHLYVEKFKRYFKEKDFLNISEKDVSFFNKIFSEDIIIKSLLV